MILGHYNPGFAARKTTVFASNTLNNAKKHLQDYYILDEEGDMWRVKAKEPTQASGLIAGDHLMIIPFRQTKFKATLLKWVILDNIKHRKITSGHLKAILKITNVLAVPALPDSSSTVGLWIHDMYY
jgi:hypothetical protein